jgi:hypothetical protein
MHISILMLELISVGTRRFIRWHLLPWVGVSIQGGSKLSIKSRLLCLHTSVCVEGKISLQMLGLIQNFQMLEVLNVWNTCLIYVKTLRHSTCNKLVYCVIAVHGAMGRGERPCCTPSSKVSRAICYSRQGTRDMSVANYKQSDVHSYEDSAWLSSAD